MQTGVHDIMNIEMPMIRIPEVIEIGGITYPVEFVDDLPSGRAAQIHFLEGVISIRSDMGDEVTFLSFIHEIVHGVMQSMNHFPDQMIYNDEDFTERTAQLMTSIFKQIMDYNLLYDEFFAPQVEEMEEKDTLEINVDGVDE
jgi:hypothetical protein